MNNGWTAAYLLLGALFVGCASTASAPSPPVAVIGARVISRDDLKERVLTEYYGQRALNGMVKERLFSLEAEALGIDIPEPEIEARMAERLSREPAGLEAELERQGLSLSDYRRDLRIEIERELLIRKVVVAQRKIGEVQIQTRFKRRYQDPFLSVQQLIFPLPPDRDLQKRNEVFQQARAAKIRLESGEAFEAVAAQFEDRGAVSRSGELRRGSIPDPDLEAAVFELDSGEVSAPLEESQRFLHLFLVEESYKPQPLEQLRDRIRKELQEAPVSLLEIEAVVERLKRKVPVTLYPENL